MKEKRKKIQVVHNHFDWSKCDGATVVEAAKYLAEFAKTVPADAIIDEHWTGYENMEIRVISWRDETDQEYAQRKESEALSEKLRKEREEADRARSERFEQYRRLKREFG